MARPVVGIVVALESDDRAAAISFDFGHAKDLRQPAIVMLRDILAGERYVHGLGASKIIAPDETQEVVVAFEHWSDDIPLVTDLLAEIAMQAGYSMAAPKFLQLPGFGQKMRERGDQGENL